MHFANEQTVHNATSLVIGGLAKGTTYTFTICLGNKEGKGPCKEIEETTLKTGNNNYWFRKLARLLLLIKNKFYHLCIYNLISFITEVLTFKARLILNFEFICIVTYVCTHY